MITRNEVSLIHSLKDKKAREEHRLFVAEGPKIADEILGSSWKIQRMFATDEYLDSHPSVRLSGDFEITPVSGSELGRISFLTTPHQVVLLVRLPADQDAEDENYKGLSLVLDQIQDPGNLGTIIRTADWFNVRHIYCSPDCADAFSPKVVQATMGSLLRVNTHYLDLSDFLGRIKEVPVYGAFASGNSIYETKLEHPAFIVIGNESKGIRAGLHPLITHSISVPRQVRSAESLNASVAAGIVMNEFQRQLSDTLPEQKTI